MLESLFSKFVGLLRSPFLTNFIKTRLQQAYNFIKKRLQHKCFPVNLAKFLRTPIFAKHLRTVAFAEN